MATGDISSVIDSLEFDSTNSAEAGSCKVTDTIIAIAYKGTDDDGFLVTVSIDADGNIGNTIIDSLEFDVAGCRWPTICHVKGDHYAIGFEGIPSHGWIKTVTIDINGNIGAGVTDSWDFSGGAGFHPALIKISDNTFAVAYDIGQVDGTIKTFKINDDGTIEKSAIDTLEFEGGDCRECDICHITGNIYTIVYVGTDLDTWIASVSIDAEGNIGPAVIDSLQINTDRGIYPRHAYLGNGIIGIVSTDYWTDGWLYTVEIDAEGNIGASIKDSWEFEAVQASYCRAIKLGANMLCVTFSDRSNHGIVAAVEIDDAGNITPSWYDSLDFDDVCAHCGQIINPQGNIVGIPYTGPDGDGWLKTTTIERAPEGRPDYLMIMGIS